MIDDRVATFGARESGIGDELIDHRPAWPARGKAGGEKNPVGNKLLAVCEVNQAMVLCGRDP